MTFLKHFPENEIYLDEMQASQVLNFFGFSTAGTSITTIDREFAQALLVEAIDASQQMWYVETLYKATSKPNSSVQSIIKSFAKKALTKWFKSKTASKVANVEIYESVKKTLSWNFSSVWRMRQNGIEFTW